MSGHAHCLGVGLYDLTFPSSPVAPRVNVVARRHGVMGWGEPGERETHPCSPSLKLQKRGARERVQGVGGKKNRRFHLYRMGLFFYLFANVQCNGLKPSRVAAAAHTQSCSATEHRQASCISSIGHYPRTHTRAGCTPTPWVPPPPPPHPRHPPSSTHNSNKISSTRFPLEKAEREAKAHMGPGGRKLVPHRSHRFSGERGSPHLPVD